MTKNYQIMKDKFFAYLSSTSLADGINRDHIYLGHSYGRNALLLGWPHDAFADAIEVIHEVNSVISKKTIGRLLTKSMMELFHHFNVRDDADPEANAEELESILTTLDSSVVEDAFDELVESLREHVYPWTVYVFLEGIVLKGIKNVDFGFCTLHKKNSDPLIADLEKLRKINAWEQKVISLENDTDHCECYLSVDVEGENEYSTNRAIQIGIDVVNILNLFLSSSRHSKTSYARIGVLGQAAISHRATTLKRTPPVSEKEQKVHYAYLMSNPPTRKHEIESKTIKKWMEYGFVKILKCIAVSEPEPGSAEARIRNAVTWYGRALRGDSISEQFVGLNIALESLLVVEENISITQRLAEGVSFLLGSDFKHREEIEKRVRDLYKVRGRIVHSGIPASDNHLFLLDEIVSNTIISFVKKEGS